MKIRNKNCMIRNDKSKFINHCRKKERMLENVLRRNERRFVKDKALDRDDFLAKADFKCSRVVVLKKISAGVHEHMECTYLIDVGICPGHSS